MHGVTVDVGIGWDMHTVWYFGTLDAGIGWDMHGAWYFGALTLDAGIGWDMHERLVLGNFGCWDMYGAWYFGTLDAAGDRLGYAWNMKGWYLGTLEHDCMTDAGISWDMHGARYALMELWMLGYVYAVWYLGTLDVGIGNGTSELWISMLG